METKICPLSSKLLSSCQWGHTAQQVFAIVPGLIPVQLHELLPVLLLHTWKLRNVATLGPFLLSHRSLGGSTRRSAASCSLHSSLPVSAECTRPAKSIATYEQVLQFFPNRSGIRLFSALPTEKVTSYQFDCRKDLTLDVQFGVLRGPLVALLTLVAIAAVILA